MLKQLFLAPFEPVLTEFSPFHHMYAPLCALRTYLRAVWCSHLELGEGCRLEDIYIYIYLYIYDGWTGGGGGSICRTSRNFSVRADFRKNVVP